jgi:hypothetical protein
MDVTTDIQAWGRYSSLRLFHNKLWVADTLGYKCGPVGIPIPEDGKYIIRPTYNPEGMGVGATVANLKKGDVHVGPLGYFWCEFFEGDQYSCDYTWNSQTKQWGQHSTYRGTKPETNLTRFELWKKVDKKIDPPSICLEFHEQGISTFNVEYIEEKAIEIHLRANPNPINYNEMIPIWSDTPVYFVDKLVKEGYIIITAYENANEFSNLARHGFLVK